MIGLEVHATMRAQLLDGARLAAVPEGWRWLAALLVVGAAGLTSLAALRWFALLPALAVQAGAIAGVPLWLQARGWDTKGMPAVGWALRGVLARSEVRRGG